MQVKPDLDELISLLPRGTSVKFQNLIFVG